MKPGYVLVFTSTTMLIPPIYFAGNHGSNVRTMLDRILSRMLTWGLCAICLIVFGIGAALYFAFCSFALGLIYARQWRPGVENKLRARGLDETERDLRMLPQDRVVAIARAMIGLAVAWGFQHYA